jgi:putative transposase
LSDEHYETFLRLLWCAKDRYPVDLFGLCVMPNHFHALMHAREDGALSAYWQWVLGCYACDLRSKTNTLGFGHVFQRRFWNRAIEDAHHFLTVLRYIEANPVRATLVRRAEHWKWGSAALRRSSRGFLLDPLPIFLPDDWLEIVNSPQPIAELDAIRRPEPTGRPAKSQAIESPDGRA